MNTQNARLIERARTIGRIEGSARYAPYQLAHLAGVSDPDSTTSSGAVFLCAVFEDWIEQVDYYLTAGQLLAQFDRESIDKDTISARVDAISTWESWRIFADLGLWQWSYDLEEHTGATSVPATRLADHARTMIAAATAALLAAMFEALEAIESKL